MTLWTFQGKTLHELLSNDSASHIFALWNKLFLNSMWKIRFNLWDVFNTLSANSRVNWWDPAAQSCPMVFALKRNVFFRSSQSKNKTLLIFFFNHRHAPERSLDSGENVSRKSKKTLPLGTNPGLRRVGFCGNWQACILTTCTTGECFIVELHPRTCLVKGKEAVRLGTPGKVRPPEVGAAPGYLGTGPYDHHRYIDM